MSMTALEAWDLIRFSEQYLEKLSDAAAETGKREELKDETGWLAAAADRVRAARHIDPQVLERARGLPDLEEIRGELAGQMQSQWAEAVERLLAGFTFHVGSRDPVVEALFPTQKLAPLHRANREVVTAFVNDFERRLKSGYVSRMLSQPNFAFATPVLEQIRAAWSRWQVALGNGEPMPEDEAAELRKALIATGTKVELAIRQARLLAEAALIPAPGVHEALGLNAKPRRRAGKSLASIDEVIARHAPGATSAEEPAAPEKPSKKAAKPAGKPEEPVAVAAPVEDAPKQAEEAPAEAAAAAPAEMAAAAEAPAEAAPAPKKKKGRKAPAGETAAQAPGSDADGASR